MMTITSSSNPAVKEVRQLKNRKDREEKGLFFVEGLRIVEEAFEANAPVAAVYLSEQFRGMSAALEQMLQHSHCRKITVTEALFREISDTETPQGILAVINAQKNDLKTSNLEGGLFVLLDSIRDPGNMGTIIRTADAAGFSGVIAGKGCVDVYNPKVLRSTMGSVFHLPIYTAADTVDAIHILQTKGIRVLASHLDGKNSIYQADLRENVALVIGSEADGISEATAAAANLLVRIPMPGRAESLNASTAAAVMIFESVRQREK